MRGDKTNRELRRIMEMERIATARWGNPAPVQDTKKPTTRTRVTPRRDGVAVKHTIKW